MDAFVLSGGSIRGSWQAGVIAEVLASGYQPGIVTGISVGALNAAWLAAHHDTGLVLGDGRHTLRELQWTAVGESLADFWLTKITGPDKLIRKRCWLEIGWRTIASKQWAGLVSTTPLAELVRATLGSAFPRQGGIQVRVGAVNLRTGRLMYFGPHEPAFLDAVLASTAEPIGMPARKIGNDLYVDGGVREITPLAEAIRLGASRIICAVCQPDGPGNWSGNPGDLMQLIGRELQICSDEIVANDLRTCEGINRLLLTLPPDVVASHPDLRDKRVVEVIVVRPLVPLALSIERFGPEHIARAVRQGRLDAARVLGERGLARAA